MEPFDYLTYKKNKAEKASKNEGLDKKLVIGILCFAFMLFIVLFAINNSAKKVTRMDFEYQMDNVNNQKQESVYGAEENVEKFSIDKRLFNIKEEENQPSKSKVVAQDTQEGEVISKDAYDEIKTANTKENQEGTVEQNDTGVQKIAIKPKLPITPKANTLSDIQTANLTSKVLIGRFTLADDARKALSELSSENFETAPFIKNINGSYSIQVGAYDNFTAARNMAAKLKLKGYNVWILQ